MNKYCFQPLYIYIYKIILLNFESFSCIPHCLGVTNSPAFKLFPPANLMPVTSPIPNNGQHTKQPACCASQSSFPKWGVEPAHYGWRRMKILFISCCIPGSHGTSSSLRQRPFICRSRPMENIVTVTLPSSSISMIVSLKWSNVKTTRQLQLKQRKNIIL